MTSLATTNAGLVRISDLSSLEYTSSISKIRHVNGKRTVTLQVTPPDDMVLEEGIDKLGKIIDKSVTSKTKDMETEITLRGKADKLAETLVSMQWSLLIVLVVIYLLLSALFSNFIYPLVILFTVLLATAGGFVGLALTNLFIAPQPLDVLTMMGFLILIGIVVNNAILIVHQSLNNIYIHNMDNYEGIVEATKTRIRPIFMSSLTSVFGMLPLVLIPGPGSEFYRGLGSVITGGLAVSMLLTIMVTPVLLYLVLINKKEK